MEQTGSPDPSELLRRYAEAGDEAAFEELVGRFKGLVFSAARRRLASNALAEEAAQTTFAIVARKASALRKVIHFAAWLHRTATQVSRTIARTESRHRRKMDALADEFDPAKGGDPDHWIAIHPHLDEALEALPERDRRVLMLRFYEDLSFREIAERTGKSEAAAQRQAHRALDKMATRLRAKGAVGATSALLGAGLAVQLSSPAPAAVATSTLAQSAIATAPGVSASALMANTIYTMSQAKTLAVSASVVLIAIVPLTMQRVAIAEEKKSIALLEDSLGQGGNGEAALGGGSALSAIPEKRRDGLGRVIDVEGEIDLAEWIDDLEALMDGGDLDRVARVTELLNSLPDRDRAQLERLFAQAQQIEIERNSLRAFLMQSLCEKIAPVQPELALGAAYGLNVDQYPFRAEIIGMALASLADVDPAFAVDTFLDAAASGQFPASSSPRDSLKRFRDPATSILFARLYDRDVAEAQRMFDALEDRDRRIALISRREDMEDPRERDRLIGYALRIAEVDQRRWALGALAEAQGASSGLGRQTLDIAQALGAQGDLPPEAAAHLIVASAKHFLGPWNAQNVESTIEWVAENSPPEFSDRNVQRARELHSAYANQ